MTSTHSTPSRVLVLLAALALGVLLLLATAAAATGSSEAVPEPQTYTVQAGDNLWSIVEGTYGSGVDARAAIHDIKRLNGLAGAGISIGQVLLLPAA